MKKYQQSAIINKNLNELETFSTNFENLLLHIEPKISNVEILSSTPNRIGSQLNFIYTEKNRSIPIILTTDYFLQNQTKIGISNSTTVSDLAKLSITQIFESIDAHQTKVKYEIIIEPLSISAQMALKLVNVNKIMKNHLKRLQQI